MTVSVSANRLFELKLKLASRDWQLIETLSKVRVATSAQLEALHFYDVSRRRAEQRLAVLVQLRVLSRLPRVVGGPQGGSRGHIYSLGVAGKRLLDLGRNWRPRPPRFVGIPYLSHALAITQVYVELVLAEQQGHLRILRYEGEPDSWRKFYGVYGRKWIYPDAHVVVCQSAEDLSDHWFLEIDLATESAPAIGRKLEAYVLYERSGNEQHRRNVFPRVLWLVPDDARATVIRREIAKLARDDTEMFDVALLSSASLRLRQTSAPENSDHLSKIQNEDHLQSNPLEKCSPAGPMASGSIKTSGSNDRI